MIEAPEPPPTISRRAALGTIARWGVGGTALFLGIDTTLVHTDTQKGAGFFTRPFWERLETGTLNESSDELAEELISRYDVRLLSPDVDLEFVDSEKVQSVLGYVVKWDAPRIEALSDILEKVPPSFYQPRLEDGQKKPLGLTLFDPSPKDQVARALGGLSHALPSSGETPSDYSGLIFYNKKMLGETIFEKEAADLTMVHELTHYAAQDRVNDLKPEIVQITGIFDENQLRQTFKSNLVHSPDFMAYDVNQRKVMYGGTNFHEFVAIGSEFYFQGYKKFMKVYNPFFGRERTHQLYEFFKAEIYEGKEY